MLGDDGKFRKLSQNFFIQPKVYNEHPKEGGNKRSYKLLSDEVVGSSPIVKLLNLYKEHFSITPGTSVLINLQTSLEERMDGDITEQGIHTGGVDNAMVMCLERKNVMGAVSEIFEDVEGERPLMKPTILKEGDAIMFRDNQVYHNVTSISPKNSNEGPAVRTVITIHSNANYLFDGCKNKNNNLKARPHEK